MKDEDKTFENERKHMNEPIEDRGALDLTYLIEEHKKEIWEYNKKKLIGLKQTIYYKALKK